MDRFYVLEIGGFTQYKYAWFEPCGEVEYLIPAPTCPACGRYIGMLRGWASPNEVVLKQARNVGDFVYGPGGCDFLVSRRFFDTYEGEGLTGIERSFPISIRRMGTTKKAKSYPHPELIGVELLHTTTQVNRARMDVVSSTRSRRDYCRLCGPGGGGGGSIHKGFRGVTVRNGTWTGHDIFYAINFPGTVLLSKRAASVILKGGFTNAEVMGYDECTDSFDA